MGWEVGLAAKEQNRAQQRAGVTASTESPSVVQTAGGCTMKHPGCNWARGTCGSSCDHRQKQSLPFARQRTDAMRCDAMRCDAVRCGAVRCQVPTNLPVLWSPALSLVLTLVLALAVVVAVALALPLLLYSSIAQTPTSSLTNWGWSPYSRRGGGMVGNQSSSIHPPIHPYKAYTLGKVKRKGSLSHPR